MRFMISVGVWVGLMALLGCGGPRPGPFGNGNCFLAEQGVHEEIFPLGADAAPNVGRVAFCDSNASLATLGTVTVTDPEGVLIPAVFELRNGNAHARFPATRSGPHRVVVNWKGFPESSGTAEIVDVGTTTFIAATYVDRMDNCNEGPFRTLQGLVVCMRSLTGAPLVSVYGRDGAYQSSFAGEGLIVRGNSVWTSVGASAELRIDEAGVLRLIGSAEIGTGGRTTATERSGLVPTAAGLMFRTARFDGQNLTVEEFPEPWPDRNRAFGVVTREGNEWWEGACRIRNGCASMPTLCEPVRKCLIGDPSNDQFVIVDDEGAWLQGGFALAQRPFDASLMRDDTFRPIQSVGAPARDSKVQLGGQAPGLPLFNGGLLIPRRDDRSFHFELLNVKGAVRTITEEFIITQPDASDPFLLRFDRPVR